MIYYVLFTLILLLIIVTFYCIKFALIVLKIQDSLAESLDILDQKYANLSKVLEIPIFYDSSEVRQVIREVEDAKRSILLIANKLTDSVEQEAVIDDEEDEE